MMYIRRDEQGKIIAVSREPADGDGWSAAGEDDADLLGFGRDIIEGANPMGASDLGLVRVLEDLIELLVERSLIRFTDLPVPAQHKLMERRGAREALQHLSLLDDDGVI
ncbi:hypothetical protein [Aromatoleum toluclasticum]|uniref:hypothetical protein n=1 Tax=Aromatoleum toluclasticum TaxID=92003 RepID=UPI000377D444|nr:hypothetical protein [Aromatoleum toluclasticum]